MAKVYADAKGMRPTNLRDQLIAFEGCIPYAYQDTRSFWTIGVGRLIDRREGGCISQDEIEYLLDNDIREKTAEVLEALPWVAALNEPRQAVLIGMCFQLGLAGLLRFVNTLAKIKDGDFEGAAIGMRRSLWAKQTPERVAILAEQLRLGVWGD